MQLICDNINTTDIANEHALLNWYQVLQLIPFQIEILEMGHAREKVQLICDYTTDTPDTL